LSQIKYCLIDSLSNKTTRNKNKITKEILIAFKDNLISMLEEKNKIYNSYRKEKQKILRKKSDNLKKYRKYIDFEKTNDSEANKIIDNQKLLNSDVSQLNLLNFLIENEIKKIDSLIEQHSQTNFYIKTLPVYIFEKNEIFCSTNNENLSKISDILNEDRNRKIKRFINIANKKTKQQNEAKSLSKKVENLKNKINYKNKKNNVVTNNINNFIKEKQLKISDNDLKRNDLLSLDKLKEKTALYYLTNISEELKAKKKNYQNGNNIFISINNYTNDNKKKSNKGNINLTEGKDNSIQNYLVKKSISQKGTSKIKRRNYLKKNGNKYKILSGSKSSSENRTQDNFNSYNSDNDRERVIYGPEMTHFFIVASIQKGIRNINNYN
jgi:hypothetical protein